MASESRSKGMPARAYVSRTSSSGRLEQAEQGLVSRDDRGAEIAHRLALARHLVRGHPNPRRALLETLDGEAGPVVLDEVGLPIVAHRAMRTTVRTVGASRNRAFPYVCVSRLARSSAMRAPSSARERMPSLR